MIVAVSMFRDEADVAQHVVEHLLGEGVDKIVVADNRSTDGTREILESLPVTVVDDSEVGYYQSAKITHLVHEHCTTGDWVIPFDADELWTGDTDTLAGALATATADVLIAPVYDYIPQPSDDPDEADPFTRIRWRLDRPEQFPVMAFRYHPEAVVKQGAHDLVHPGVRSPGLWVDHFQYRSWQQFCRKLRNGREAYASSNLPAWEGAHWRTWGALDDEALRVHWDALLATPGLVYDPCR
jgi:hypothetical protein